MVMENMIVYALSDPVTGEVRYIGKSERGLRRPREHGTGWSLRNHSHLPVVRWIKKLRDQGFDYAIEVIEECQDRKSTLEAERYWISQFRAWGFKLLNICDGGEGRTGPLSEETKAKMRAVQNDPEHKRHLSETIKELHQDPIYRKKLLSGIQEAHNAPGWKSPWQDRTHSSETRDLMSKNRRSKPRSAAQLDALQKIQQSNVGRKGPERSSEWRAKCGYWKGKESPQKGIKRTEEQRLANALAQGARPFYDQNGTIYQALYEAVEKLGLAKTKICAVLKGRLKSTGGYVFKYVE